MSGLAVLAITFGIFTVTLRSLAKLVEKIRFLRFIKVLKLYFPICYLFIILLAVGIHFLYPAEIIGEGKTKFSIGATIGIISNLPGIYLLQYVSTLGLDGGALISKILFPEDDSWRGLFSLLALNFIFYWIINLLFAFFHFSYNYLRTKSHHSRLEAHRKKL